MGILARGYGFAIASLSLSSCIPWVDRYPAVEAPAAVYYRNSCSVSTGPPAIAYYPFHGIFVSISVNGTVRLGLHIPSGYSVQIDKPFVQLSQVNGGETAKTYPIQAFQHGVYGDPDVFHRLGDPYTGPNNFGPLIGDGEGTNSRFFLFISVSSTDPVRLAQFPMHKGVGTVTLPGLTINGQRFGPQALQFAPKSHFELAPINC